LKEARGQEERDEDAGHEKGPREAAKVELEGDREYEKKGRLTV
jgi:hypothetical protein